MLRVGLHENISILFLLAIKSAGSAQKLRVGLFSGNTAIFLFTPNAPFFEILHMSMHISKLNGGYKPQSRYSTSILTCIRPDSDALKNSFFHRTIQVWNSIPSRVVSSKTISGI